MLESINCSVTTLFTMFVAESDWFDNNN